MANKKRANLAYIAGKCGVSKMTVSRALRNDPCVAESTRQMILQAANEANYIPSSARRFGAESCHKRYYILFESNYAEQGSFFSELILSIQRELFADGASCFLGNIDGGYPEFLKLFNIMQAEDLAGVFIVGGAPVEHINAVLAGFPNVVLVDNPGDVRLGRPYNAVVFDNRAGCYLAVNHLLILGRRRILMACGPEQHYFSREMLLGYESAHQNAGIKIDRSLIYYGGFRLADGQDIVASALSKGVEFDAVFSTDMMACGAINALKDFGRSIPGDVAVAGFDGLPIGKAITPSLTTVVADRDKMGRLAVQRIRDVESCPGDEGRHLKLSLFPELVPGPSSMGRKRG